MKPFSFLLDANVIFDILLKRPPYEERAIDFYSLVDSRRHRGYLCATSITTIHYVLEKNLGHARALKHVGSLLKTFSIASVDERILQSAFDRGFPDYEDAVVHESAMEVHADAIVTRDTKGFIKSLLPVFNPMEAHVIMLPKRKACVKG